MSRGLSVNGVDYFSDFMSTDSDKKPSWMQFGAKIGAMVGDYRILNFITGFEGLDQFTFRTPKWPIGGMYFDGILRTEHLSRVRTTNYPVQTGVTMTTSLSVSFGASPTTACGTFMCAASIAT